MHACTWPKYIRIPVHSGNRDPDIDCRFRHHCHHWQLSHAVYLVSGVFATPYFTSDGIRYSHFVGSLPTSIAALGALLSLICSICILFASHIILASNFLGIVRSLPAVFGRGKEHLSFWIESNPDVNRESQYVT